MTNLLIIAVMITVLLGAATYGLMNASNSLLSQINRATTEARLEEAARGVIANIVAIPSSTSLSYAIPAPDSLTNSNVPSWITPNSKNARGVNFLYCPYSNVVCAGAGCTSSITVPSTTYGVVQAALYSGGRNYITQSVARPTNQPSALAIIVAPGEKSASAPDCTTVSTTGTVTGGTAYVITEADVAAKRMVNASSGNEFNIGTSASGDGTGRNSSNAATIATVMGYVNNYMPQYAKLDFTAGTYNISSTDLIQQTSGSVPLINAGNSAMAFVGTSSAGTLLQSTSGSSINANLIGNLYLHDLGFTQSTSDYIWFSVSRPGAFIADNSGLPYINSRSASNVFLLGPTSWFAAAGGGTLFMYPQSRLYANSVVNLPTGTNYDLQAQGSLVTFGGNSQTYFTSSADDCFATATNFSRFYMSGWMTTTSVNGMLACANHPSQFYFNNANVSIGNASANNRAFITDAGRVVVDNFTTFASLASPPVTYLVADQGSEIFITNSTMGAVGSNSLRPGTADVTLQDASNDTLTGAMTIGGGTTGGWTGSSLSVSTSGQNCWYGNANTNYVAVDAATGNSAVSLSQGTLGDEPWIIANRSDWTCHK